MLNFEMLRQKAEDLLKLKDIYLRQLQLIDKDYYPKSEDDAEDKETSAELFGVTQNSLINRAIIPETISECCRSKDELLNNEFTEIYELQKNLHQECIAKLQSVNRLKNELMKLQEKSFGLMLEDRKLWTKLDEMKSSTAERDETHNEALVRLENQVKRNSQITKVVHEVFQQVILASKIDWSEDEELSRVMLEDV